MNMYAYVGGDPVNFTDPTGMMQHPIRDEISVTGQSLLGLWLLARTHNLVWMVYIDAGNISGQGDGREARDGGGGECLEDAGGAAKKISPTGQPNSGLAAAIRSANSLNNKMIEKYNTTGGLYGNAYRFRSIGTTIRSRGSGYRLGIPNINAAEGLEGGAGIGIRNLNTRNLVALTISPWPWSRASSRMNDLPSDAALQRSVDKNTMYYNALANIINAPVIVDGGTCLNIFSPGN